ncbi:MAG: phosphatidylglycerol lysyltransferase domain-containing protein [Candidatus Thiodiazotropha sp.]
MHSLLDGMLVTWILTARGRLYLPCLPVGGGSLAEVVSILNQCASYCVDWNLQSGFSHKPVVAKLSSNQLDFFHQSHEFKHQFTSKVLTGIERHLSISHLTSLTGKRFSTVRYKLNSFHRNYPTAKLRMYQPDDLEDVIRLKQLWNKSAGTKHRRIQDSFYFNATIKHHEALGLENLVVELDGRIIGMTTGGVLPTGEAWGYIMKYDNSFIGLSEYLVIAMAQRIHEIEPKAELINIGTDFGNRQLAMAKEKFRPVKAYRRFALHMRPSSA